MAKVVRRRSAGGGVGRSPGSRSSRAPTITALPNHTVRLIARKARKAKRDGTMYLVGDRSGKLGPMPIIGVSLAPTRGMAANELRVHRKPDGNTVRLLRMSDTGERLDEVTISLAFVDDDRPMVLELRDAQIVSVNVDGDDEVVTFDHQGYSIGS